MPSGCSVVTVGWAAIANEEKTRNTIAAKTATGILNLVIFISLSPDFFGYLIIIKQKAR